MLLQRYPSEERTTAQQHNGSECFAIVQEYQGEDAADYNPEVQQQAYNRHFVAPCIGSPGCRAGAVGGGSGPEALVEPAQAVAEVHALLTRVEVAVARDQLLLAATDLVGHDLVDFFEGLAAKLRSDHVAIVEVGAAIGHLGLDVLGQVDSRDDAVATLLDRHLCARSTFGDGGCGVRGLGSVDGDDLGHVAIAHLQRAARTLQGGPTTGAADKWVLGTGLEDGDLGGLHFDISYGLWGWCCSTTRRRIPPPRGSVKYLCVVFCTDHPGCLSALSRERTKKTIGVCS